MQDVFGFVKRNLSEHSGKGKPLAEKVVRGQQPLPPALSDPEREQRSEFQAFEIDRKDDVLRNMCAGVVRFITTTTCEQDGMNAVQVKETIS